MSFLARRRWLRRLLRRPIPGILHFIQTNPDFRQAIADSLAKEHWTMLASPAAWTGDGSISMALRDGLTNSQEP